MSKKDLIIDKDYLPGGNTHLAVRFTPYKIFRREILL